MVQQQAQDGVIRARVLVIDDEFGPRESLRMLFKGTHDVVCVDSVDAGVAKIRDLQPHVVITDIKMPGKNGIEGLQEIRAVDPNVSIIMLTGFGSLDTAKAALRHGATDYMTKPFDKDEMLEAIARYANRTEAMRRRASALRELEAINARLAQEREKSLQLASLGQLSSEYIHDLGNPLSVVGGCVGLLSEKLREGDGWGSPESIEYLDCIQKSLDRCFSLLERWRDFGRKDRSRMTAVAVAGILRDVVDTSRPMAARAGGRIILAENGPACKVMADRLELARALQNVVGNAIQALPPEDGRIEVAWCVAGDRVEIAVRDNGKGIPQDKIEQVFDPYYSTKRATGGMGLGLFITRKVIDNHDGTIRLENNAGRGVTARISLPLCEA